MKFVNVKSIYLLTVVVVTTFTAAGLIFITQVNYETLISGLVAIVNKPGVENILRAKALPADKFSLIKQLCYAGLLLLIFAAWFLIKFRDSILGLLKLVWRSIYDSYKSVLNVYRSYSKKQNIILLLLLLVIICKSLYYINSWDLQYDEMWCYNYYTAQPFYFSFFMYSNYPLYEIITNLFEWMPFSMKVNLRLPVLLMGLAACILLHACLKKYLKNDKAALAGTVLFAFMPVTTFYMLYARGVIFELFFAIAALFSLLFWLKNERTQNKYLVIYIISNVLGIYSMPTHIYYWLLLCLISVSVCFFKYKQERKKIILANLLVVLLAAICYLPVFAGSGFSFVENAVSDKINMWDAFQSSWGIAAGISIFFTGFGFSIVVAIVIYLILLSLKQNKKYQLLIIFCISLCILPVSAYIVQGFYITERAWAFAGLAIPLATSLLFITINKYLQSAIAYVIICAAGTGAAVISDQHTFLNWSREQDKQTIEIAGLFMKNKIGSCYDKSTGSGFFYYYPGIEFYYKRENESISIAMAAANSMRYVPFNASDNYDCIVYKLNDTVSVNNYKEIYRDAEHDFKIMMRDK
ncbi:MAG TPA: hypothetical protein PLA68_01520 [Panacibacter sp.]|nr:hypothetical protein [Panacibacter sp.]